MRYDGLSILVIHACKGLEDAHRFAMDIGPPRDLHDRRSYRVTITDGPLAISSLMLRHMPTTSPDYSSQHSRMRSNRKVLSASLRWQCAIIDATPWTSSTIHGVIMRGCGLCYPCSYTIVIVHRSAIAVESTSKPGGGSMAQTGALAKVSSGEI
jgi:hypothetical protein